MLLHLLDSTNTTITYLAGLGGDGTKGSVSGIVSKVIQIVGWAGAGIFAWRLLQHYWAPAKTEASHKASGTAGMTTEASRSLMHEAITFAVFQGVLAVVWQLLNTGQGFFYGLF